MYREELKFIQRCITEECTHEFDFWSKHKYQNPLTTLIIRAREFFIYSDKYWGGDILNRLLVSYNKYIKPNG